MMHSFVFESGFGNIEVFDIEITQGSHVQRNQIQVPLIMAQAQFTSLVQQAAQVKTPCKVKISQPYNVWDQFDKKLRSIERSLEFWNFAWDEKDKGGKQSNEDWYGYRQQDTNTTS